MQIRLSFLSLWVVCFVFACAVPATHHNITKYWTTSEDYDALWSGVIELFAHNSIPILTLEKDSGIIVSEWFVLARSDAATIDCGSPGIATAYETHPKLTVTVAPTGTTRQIMVSGRYKQRRTFDRDTFFATCYSRGEMEHNLKEIILSNASAKQ